MARYADGVWLPVSVSAGGLVCRVQSVRSEKSYSEPLKYFSVVEDRMGGCDEKVLSNVQGGMATRLQRAFLDEVRRQSIIPGPSAQRHFALHVAQDPSSLRHADSNVQTNRNVYAGFQHSVHTLDSHDNTPLASITVLIRPSFLEPQRLIPPVRR